MALWLRAPLDVHQKNGNGTLVPAPGCAPSGGLVARGFAAVVLWAGDSTLVP